MIFRGSISFTQANKHSFQYLHMTNRTREWHPFGALLLDTIVTKWMKARQNSECPKSSVRGISCRGQQLGWNKNWFSTYLGSFITFLHRAQVIFSFNVAGGRPAELERNMVHTTTKRRNSKKGLKEGILFFGFPDTSPISGSNCFYSGMEWKTRRSLGKSFDYACRD